MEEQGKKNNDSKRKRQRKSIIIVCISIIINMLIGCFVGINIGKAMTINNLAKNGKSYTKGKAKENIEDTVENENSEIAEDKDENEGISEEADVEAQENGKEQEEDEKEINILEGENPHEIQNRLETWNFQSEDGNKTAYLTFDDGPSEILTQKILDVLDKYNIKVTFFVLGTSIERGEYEKKMIRKIASSGHVIANHGYCHNYEMLYPNGVVDVDFFMNDIKKTEKIINDALGYDYENKVIRCPGGHGSWYTEALDPVLEEEGYSFIDWNALTGDAEAGCKSKEELEGRLKETIQDIDGNNDILVVLMHDTDEKTSTVESLEDNILYLKSLGYKFGVLK